MVGDVTPHVNAGLCNTFISFYLENTYPTTHYLSYPFPLLFISVVLKGSCQAMAAMRNGCSVCFVFFFLSIEVK